MGSQQAVNLYWRLPPWSGAVSVQREGRVPNMTWRSAPTTIQANRTAQGVLLLLAAPAKSSCN